MSQKRRLSRLHIPNVYDDTIPDLDLQNIENDASDFEEVLHGILSRVKLNAGVTNWFNGVPGGDNQSLLNEINGIKLALYPIRADLSSQNDGSTFEYIVPDNFDANSLIVIYAGRILHTGDPFGYTVTGSNTFSINKTPDSRKRVEVIYWKKDP